MEEEKQSRADIKYVPANVAPLSQIAERHTRTQADRDLVIKSIDNIIEENEK